MDLAEELDRAQKEVDNKYAYLEEQLTVLKDYDDISSQYSRYSSSYLREDEDNHTITQEEALSNGPKVVQGHFSVPKVVK